MIPKKDCEHGVYYNGICRNSRIAMWDNSIEQFRYYRNKFGFRSEMIEHFDDVRDKQVDGFIPIEKIETLSPEITGQARVDVGYFK